MENKNYDDIENQPLDKPMLKRENYDYLPWSHSSFESWEKYVRENCDKDGLVFGFGLNDWCEDYAHDYFDDLDIAFPIINSPTFIPISQEKELKELKMNKLNVINLSLPFNEKTNK